MTDRNFGDKRLADFDDYERVARDALSRFANECAFLNVNEKEVGIFVSSVIRQEYLKKSISDKLGKLNDS